MRRLVLALALSAAAAFAGIKTYPPSGTGGIAGGGGPLLDEYVPFGDASLPPLYSYYSLNGSVASPTGVPTHPGYDSTGRRHMASYGSPTSLAKSIYAQAGGPLNSPMALTTTEFRFSGSFSISFWMRFVSYAGFGYNDGFQRAFMAGIVETVTDYDITLPAFSSVVYMTCYDSTAGSIVATGGTLTTTYQHYVFVYDAATRKVQPYLNGTPGTLSAALTNGLKQTSTNIRMGPYSSVFAQNRIVYDEFAIFPSVLSGANVTSLYNGGAGRFY